MKEEPIGKYLGIAFRTHAMFIDKKLKSRGFEVSRGQFFLLGVLYKKGPMTQHNLCEMFNMDKAAVNRGVKKIVNMGYIHREVSNEDKRRVLLHLTQKAKDIRPEFYSLLQEVDREIKSGLTEEEIEDVLSILKKICSNLGHDIAGDNNCSQDKI
ncbi:MAG: MarR family winged helix-turn-helix transcriptional regulator [Clostridiales bacterium]|nr:MarR family winged helix-turn-helix transcriptional regulator [Clostridiales bacterium]MCF8023713.1 MarR family winged helix-turn-helix transcriptional regulator [Clostridiales bacterium]